MTFEKKSFFNQTSQKSHLYVIWILLGKSLWILISNSLVILFNNHNIFAFSTHSFLFFYPHYPSAHPHLSVISFSVLPTCLSKEDTNENEKMLLILIDFSQCCISLITLQTASFYMKCNTGLKLINSFLRPKYVMLCAIWYHL